MIETVSIVIPTYMRAATIRKAIDSCYAQDVDLEVIVVDDGSFDETSMVLHKEYGDAIATKRLRYYYQENKGPSAARNLGMLNCHGDYIKFLDSDDVLVPGALRKELECAIATKCDVVVTGWRNDYYENANLTSIYRREEAVAPDFSKPLDAMLHGLAPWTSAALYRVVAIKHLRWNTEFDKAEEWLWVWGVLFEDCKFVTLPLTSAVWNHYPSTQRLTMKGDSYDRSCRARSRILRIVGERLQSKGVLNSERRRQLCQYFHKDAVWASRTGYREWRDLYSYIRSIDPDFVPEESNAFLFRLIRSLGYINGVYAYGRVANLKSIFDKQSGK